MRVRVIGICLEADTRRRRLRRAAMRLRDHQERPFARRRYAGCTRRWWLEAVVRLL